MSNTYFIFFIIREIPLFRVIRGLMNKSAGLRRI